MPVGPDVPGAQEMREAIHEGQRAGQELPEAEAIMAQAHEGMVKQIVEGVRNKEDQATLAGYCYRLEAIVGFWESFLEKIRVGEVAARDMDIAFAKQKQQEAGVQRPVIDPSQL